MFVWPTSNTVCIILRVFLSTVLHCSEILILEMFVVIAATFYKSFKNMPPKEKTFKEKFRRLWIFLIVAISVSLLINTIRGLLIFVNDDIFITDDGYCISLMTEGAEDQAAVYIAIATILTIVFATASVFVLIIVLFCVLSKHNSVTVNEINRKLVKIAVILIGSTGISIIVFYVVALSTHSIYSSVFALAMRACEQICILIILSRVKGETTHQATSSVESN